MAHRRESRTTFSPARRIRYFQRSISQQSLATISHFAIPTRHHRRRTSAPGRIIRSSSCTAFPLRNTKRWPRRHTQKTLQAAKCVPLMGLPGNADLTHSEPGGYLQWVEYDPISFKVVSPDPSLKQSANEKHVHIIRGPDGKATESVSHLIFPRNSAIFPSP